MLTFIILGIILLISFVVSLASMRDFGAPASVKKIFSGTKKKGTILFLKNKVKHYSSASSSSSVL